MSEALETLRGDYARSVEHAEAHKASGKRVVGYFFDSLPTELIEAAGLLPLRVTELWENEYGCEFYPLDFNMLALLTDIPTRWWERTRDHWRELVEPRRLAERVAQGRGLLQRLEAISKRRFKAPKSVVFLEVLPRYPTGKVLHRVLHETYARENIE